MTQPRRIIAITMGDPAGVGPEIAMKTVLDQRVQAVCRPVLFGDRRALDAHAAACGLDFRYRAFRALQDADVDSTSHAAVIHQDSLDADYRLGQVSAQNGRAAVAALDSAVDTAIAGDVAAVVAGPIHEVAIHHAGIAFDGHPSYLARRTGTPPEAVFLMLCYDGTRIVHATLHLSVRQALDRITRERVASAIRACHRALQQLGIGRGRIGVSGLNPHAGEAGLFGREEIDIIAPAVEDARRDGVDVIGPFGADTLLARNDCDAFVVMLHDQGHVAAKLTATHAIAALSIGTPILFSSVGHGTAMDIAGKGCANPEAMVQAVLQLVNVNGGVHR